MEEKEEEIFDLLVEKYPGIVTDRFEAEDIAFEINKLFNENKCEERGLEAEIIFLLNEKGKSVLDSKNGREFLDSLLELC